MAQEFQMPQFARAGNGAVAAQSDWGEVDNLDVDLLAEYLLEDNGMTVGGVSFDFK